MGTSPIEKTNVKFTVPSAKTIPADRKDFAKRTSADVAANNVNVARKLTLAENWEVEAEAPQETQCCRSLRLSAQRLQRTIGTNISAGVLVRPDSDSIPWWLLGASWYRTQHYAAAVGGRLLTKRTR